MPRKSTWLQNSLLTSQLALGSEHEGHIPTPQISHEFTGTEVGYTRYNPETDSVQDVFDQDEKKDEDVTPSSDQSNNTAPHPL